MSYYKTIYRFENSKLLGPWSGLAKGAYEKATNFKEDPSDMPCLLSSEEEGTPAHEHFMKKGNGLDGMSFGFTSVDQIKYVFGHAGGRLAMKEKGQRLLVFKVNIDDYLAGNTQCIFRRDNAEITGELDMETLEFIPA